jgi:hypothetical protein
MSTVNDICDWLANHELVAVALTFGICAAVLVGICEWMKQGIIPDEHDEHEDGGP